MRVMHIVPYLPIASGVSTFVTQASDAMAARGHRQTVAVNDMEHYTIAHSFQNVPRIGIKEAFTQIQFRQCDIVHMHGIWPLFMHRIVNTARKAHLPIIWSLHGMLAPWAMRYKRWKKLPAWVLWQKRDLSYASAIHVTSTLEADGVARMGINVPLINVPLGTKMHECVDWSKKDNAVLFVGRLDPVKAIDNLILAWSAIVKCPVGKEWVLRIVGTDTIGYGDKLRKLVSDIGLDGSIQFLGAKYDEALDEEYRKSKIVVLPSHTENFGGVVIDALSWGVPVVASRNTPWQALDEKKCGKWVHNSPDAIAVALKDLMHIGLEELKAMGDNGRHWVADKFSWESVARQLVAGYEAVLLKGDKGFVL